MLLWYAKYSVPKNVLYTRLLKDAEETLLHLSRSLNTIELHLADSASMREMKKTYLKKEQEIVDVLAFPADTSFPNPDLPDSLGEIYLNEEAFGEDYEKMRFLLVHGVLHLLGYDHQEDHDTMEMEKLEALLCQHLVSLD